MRPLANANAKINAAIFRCWDLDLKGCFGIKTTDASPPRTAAGRCSVIPAVIICCSRFHSGILNPPPRINILQLPACGQIPCGHVVDLLSGFYLTGSLGSLRVTAEVFDVPAFRPHR